MMMRQFCRFEHAVFFFWIFFRELQIEDLLPSSSLPIVVRFLLPGPGCFVEYPSP